MSNSNPLVSVNGVVGKQISPLDRGFAYGDGLFETCRLVSGKIPLWDLHLQRLAAGCAHLRIPLDIQKLEQYRRQLLAESGRVDGIFKVIVTRGEGGRGYAPPASVIPTLCQIVFESPAINLQHSGVAVRICHQQLAASPTLAGLKHLNRLEQILARTEWSDADIADGLLTNTQGQVIEATSSNLFWCRNGVLYTPDLSQCGVEGVMRRFIIETLAPQTGIAVEISMTDVEGLMAADEVFICNAANGIWPVISIESNRSQVFVRGDITLALQKALAQLFSPRFV